MIYREIDFKELWILFEKRVEHNEAKNEYFLSKESIEEISKSDLLSPLQKTNIPALVKAFLASKNQKDTLFSPVVPIPFCQTFSHE